MTDRDYAIKSMKEITFQMASHAQDYLEVTIERHYTDIKELMTSYQKLILENQIVLEELDMECQEKINEDMAYALSYLSIYNNQLNVPKMHREMNNLMIIYGLSDMIYRGMTLVKFYAPNGVMLSEILHSCFCSHYNKTDVEVQQELGIGRTSFYKMKKQALGYLGFYFYEIVVPQAKDNRFKPSLGVEEEWVSNMRYEDSMKGVAAQIIKEQQRASKIKNNPEEFHWHDEYATLNFFRFICKNIGNLGNGEIEKMVTRLKNIDQKAVENHVNGAIWAFDYDKMFCVLMENEICRKVCEKNKYNSWMKLIGQYCISMA